MKIGVVAPSRSLNPEAQALATGLAPNGIELVFHPQCFLQQGHFAGPDKARATAFVDFANDPAFDAIWFARGGYGACRLLDRVMPQLNQAARAKTYLGYSDAGFLLAALYKRGIGKPVHGPMVMDGLLFGPEPVQRVLDYFSGASVPAIDQKSVAFNIAVLADLISTPYMPPLKGHVLMLEDIGEHLYRLDRALFNIFNSEAIKGAAGVKLGRVSNIPVNDIPFGETIEEIVQRWCKSSGISYLGRADIGHDAQNKIVPFGL